MERVNHAMEWEQWNALMDLAEQGLSAEQIEKETVREHLQRTEAKSLYISQVLFQRIAEAESILDGLSEVIPQQEPAILGKLRATLQATHQSEARLKAVQQSQQERLNAGEATQRDLTERVAQLSAALQGASPNVPHARAINEFGKALCVAVSRK